MKRPFLAALSALSLALPLAGTPAQAQEIEGLSVSPGSTVLSISGQGRSTRKPDVASFSAGVVTTGKTAGEALAANSTAMTKVFRALKSAGIADRDIQTSNLSINPVYGSRPRNVDPLEQEVPPIIGYRASNTVMVKQRKLDQYGKVIDTLISAGANQVNGPNFQMDDPEDALDEARRDAMAKTRERAQLYANAAGLKVRRILSISESGGYSPGPPVIYARMAADEAAPAPPVAEGEVEMQINVQVMFELAP